MRQLVQSTWVAATVAAVGLGFGFAASSPAQVAPADAKKASTTPKVVSPPRPPGFDQVVATVNGEKITKGDVIAYLSRLTAPPGKDKELYDYGVEMLVNTKLLNQFLKKQKLDVSKKDVDEAVARIEADFKARNTSLADALVANNSSMAELREQIGLQIAWRKYVMAKGTDANLQKFVEEHKDSLSGAQVRASIILAAFEPDPPAAEKEKARQKALTIKKEIESGQISFADAANKYSDEARNKTSPAGGDIGFMTRDEHGDALGAAAFALKKGGVSDPVETQMGYYLIQVTDRKEGSPIDFAKFRENILNRYAVDLQPRIIAEERKTAKIDVKPMPADFFPPIPAPAATSTRTPADAPAPTDAEAKPKR